MSNRHCLAALIALALSAPVAQAQFTGPSARGQEMTVAAATAARPGTYVTMTGTVVSHLRGDYYLFRDASGEVRVEIEDDVWRGRSIGPETRVRLVGEVDRGSGGSVYVWIKSLDPAN
jgi:uncharacterized protein (TIGR00156 family)